MIESGDYISREAAIEAMYKDAEAHPNHTFWTTQYEALLNIPAADVRPRWIPVAERKPKTDDIAIVAIHDDSGDTPYDVTNVGFYLDVFPLGIWVVENERCNYVTHWMPLPEPPEEVSQK